MSFNLMNNIDYKVGIIYTSFKRRRRKSKNQIKDEKLNSLIDEFLNMEKPTKEIIRELIERIEIHSDKQVDIYFNFKPLQELNENLNSFICAKKEYERKCS